MAKHQGSSEEPKKPDPLAVAQRYANSVIEGLVPIMKNSEVRATLGQLGCRILGASEIGRYKLQKPTVGDYYMHEQSAKPLLVLTAGIIQSEQRRGEVRAFLEDLKAKGVVLDLTVKEPQTHVEKAELAGERQGGPSIGGENTDARERKKPDPKDLDRIMDEWE